MTATQKGNKKRKDLKEVLDDDSELIRRSDRKRRKVYETLNVQMLTDHRYLTGFENSKSPKKKTERKRYMMEEESDPQTEDEVIAFALFILKLAPFWSFWRHLHRAQYGNTFIRFFLLVVPNTPLRIKEKGILIC